MSYFSSYPENTYLLLCLCAHCNTCMIVNLERDNIHKYNCKKCGKFNRILNIRQSGDGSLDSLVLRFNKNT